MIVPGPPRRHPDRYAAVDLPRRRLGMAARSGGEDDDAGICYAMAEPDDAGGVSGSASLAPGWLPRPPTISAARPCCGARRAGRSRGGGLMDPPA